MPLNELLCRKEIAAHFKRGRTTVWQWEREGLHLTDGRASIREVQWFLVQRDVAYRLAAPYHMTDEEELRFVQAFFDLSLATRIDVVWQHHPDRVSEHFGTPPNIGNGDIPRTIG